VLLTTTRDQEAGNCDAGVGSLRDGSKIKKKTKLHKSGPPPQQKEEAKMQGGVIPRLVCHSEHGAGGGDLSREEIA